MKIGTQTAHQISHAQLKPISTKNLQQSIRKQSSNREELQQANSSTMFQFLRDFIGLYDLGESKEKTLMKIGVIVGLISGAAFPISVFIWGKEIDHIIEKISTLKQTLNVSTYYFLALVTVAIIGLLLNVLLFAIWKLISQTIARKFREKYIQAFVRKNMAWIDSVNIYETFNSFKQNMFKIQKAIGDKVALFFNLVGMIISGLVFALSMRWTFSLILIGLLPLGIAVFGYFIYVIIMKKIDMKQFYKNSQKISVQALAMIRTVKALGAEKHQQQLYIDSLNHYIEKIRVYPLKISISTGLFYFIQYFIFGVGFLFGIQCVRGTKMCPASVTGSHYSIGQLHIVFFQIFICTFNLLQLAANYEAIREAINSSKEIYSFCKQQPIIKKPIVNLNPEQNDENLNVTDDFGDVQFRNIVFSYPQNPDKLILKRLSIKPLKNKFNAIVGATGSGKSTIASLSMKFYTVSQGHVLFGGRSIINIDEQQLRKNISYVSQDPVLYEGTIGYNVRVGQLNATDEQVWDSLRKSNLQMFVKNQPGQLNYEIGINGIKLSGGQRQRLAIARALIKRPKLLILDEATSALDRKSEKMVQKTLQNLFTEPNLNMTVICIAHKIRTIQKADQIWYLQNGEVKQSGIFAEMQCFQKFKNIVIDHQNDSQNDYIVNDKPTVSKGQNQQIKQQNIQRQISQSQINIYSELLKYTEQYKKYIFSIFLSFLNGLCHPFAISLLAHAYYQLAKIRFLGYSTDWCSFPIPLLSQACEHQLNNHFNQSSKYLGILIGFSFFCFVPFFLQHYLMSRIEEEISCNLKRAVYKKLIRMPVQWYDLPDNQGGQAASNYSLDVTQMSSLVTTYIPISITNTTTMVAGAIICLVYYWKVGLLTLYTIPLLAIGCYITMIFVSGYDDDTLLKYSSSNKTALEIMISIKTSLSFNHHHTQVEQYKSLIKESDSSIMKNGAKIGSFYGISVCIIVLSIALMIYPTAHIVSTIDESNYLNATISVVVPLWCGWVAGCSFFFVSGSAAGKQSAKRVFSLLEAQSQSDIQRIKSQNIVNIHKDQIRGEIRFKNVSFRYKDTAKYILKNLNFVIEAGQKVAFVGESGCGKSTLMLLLQRFYDFQGEIFLDGRNIYDYNLDKYRSYFSIINQQPSLFTGTLRANIIANNNAPDNQLEDVCESSLVYDISRDVKVAKQENIKSFLEKDAGQRGTKISGGEKQRVACARALLKHPKIFLMDEGTSALDVETEKKLLINIKKHLKGVTTINVAHRMEAIENCDVIFLIEDGKIVEHGPFDQLISKQGHFCMFVQGCNYKAKKPSRNSTKLAPVVGKNNELDQRKQRY